MNIFAVLTADIINSRGVRDRNQLQNNIEKTLNKINLSFEEELSINLQFVLGDEFQCLISDLSITPRIISTLRENLYPTEIRAAIGIGSISTTISGQITKMDGPAFHLARTAMNNILNNKTKRTVYLTENGDIDEALAAITQLYDLILTDRTSKQWEALRLYREEKNIKKVADLLDVKFQNVSKRLRRAHREELEQIDRNLGVFLSKTFT